MSERFKVTKFDEPSAKPYKNYGATSAESDFEATGKLLQNSAKPDHQQRIVGGTITTINNWPFTSGLLYSWNLQTFTQECGGTIITTTAIVSAAHCFYGDNQNNWRARVGSSYANSGGVVHNLRQIIIHPSYNSRTFDNDVAVLRTSINIVYNVNVQPGSIAGSNYYLADNQVVWAVGWGATSFSGPLSEQLRQVQIWTVNQATCRSRYAELGVNITDNMLCSGWLDVGGRDQCQGDSGGPLSHNNVIVGIASFGYQCGSPRFPGVNARVSRYTYWIQSAASFTFCITKNRWRSITSIDKWPYLTALLYSRDLVRYSLGCGGSIITTTAVLSAAHCFVGDTADNWRARVGSTNSNNGGIVHNFNRIVIHESYAKSYPFDNDVAILRTTSSIAYNANVQPARIASAIFDLADNSVVWAIGWGATIVQGPPSEQLRDVQIWTVNQAICKSRYAELGVTITDNMLCSGWLDVGGRDQCQGDSGGPLVHNSIVVGLSSFGYSCALPRYPGVNTRVSRLTSWIQKTATS